jgi:hypothetical protein
VSEPEPNAIGTAQLVVQQSDCASDLKLDKAPDETFPAVFATTRMIALMKWLAPVCSSRFCTGVRCPSA